MSILGVYNLNLNNHKFVIIVKVCAQLGCVKEGKRFNARNLNMDFSYMGFSLI